MLPHLVMLSQLVRRPHIMTQCWQAPLFILASLNSAVITDVPAVPAPISISVHNLYIFHIWNMNFPASNNYILWMLLSIYRAALILSEWTFLNIFEYSFVIIQLSQNIRTFIRPNIRKSNIFKHSFDHYAGNFLPQLASILENCVSD